MTKKQRGSAPAPGRPVRGSRTGRPIMAAFDLLGRRWMLRVLWELRGGGVTFRALQARCGEISPTVLNTRLGELRDAGLADSSGEGYVPTALGQGLLEALAPLDAWARRWASARPAGEGESAEGDG